MQTAKQTRAYIDIKLAKKEKKMNVGEVYERRIKNTKLKRNRKNIKNKNQHTEKITTKAVLKDRNR